MASLFLKSNLDRLAQRMCRGDEAAAEALYRELVGKVFGFCMNRVGRREVAEDLTQEIFLKVVSGITTFDAARGSFVVWFWQLARNTVTDYYRRSKDVPFSDIGEQEDVEGLATHDPRGAFAARFAVEGLHVFVGTLSSEEQELFQLRYVADLSYREIAKVLDTSEGTLRVAASRLKHKIKGALKEK